jgi:hypothetical protein
MKNLLQFTINVKKSHRQTQRTLQLVCEDHVLFVRADRFSLCEQQRPKCEGAIRLLYPRFFHELRPNPQTKI